MSNPFEALNISDDEQDQFVSSKTEKVRTTHKQRREKKKLGDQQTTTVTSNVRNEDIPVRVRDNAKQVRHNRQGRPVKGVTQGHTLDRRSGTGRQDRPRKLGGGRGNVGNVKDELNKDKYQKPSQQVTATTPVEEEPVEQTKPQEPQKLTLAEYYQSRGVQLNVSTAQKNVPVKKQVNAEWLKKQKLTLLQTKEDKKRTQQVRQNLTQHNNTRVEMDLGNSEFLGFGTKPAQKPKEEEQPRDNNTKGGYKGKKGPKVALKEDDFPTL